MTARLNQTPKRVSTLTTGDQKLRKTQLVLPEDTAELLQVLSEKDPETRNQLIVELKVAGWTFESMGQALDISRERVRQLYQRTVARATDPDTGKYTPTNTGYKIPTPPVAAKREPKLPAEPSEQILARMLELQPFAEKVRSDSPHYREEAEEYTRLINHANAVEGVSLARLARLLGRTHAALRFRLVRYGYKEPTENARLTNPRPYKTIKAENRSLIA